MLWWKSPLTTVLKKKKKKKILLRSWLQIWCWLFISLFCWLHLIAGILDTKQSVLFDRYIVAQEFILAWCDRAAGHKHSVFCYWQPSIMSRTIEKKIARIIRPFGKSTKWVGFFFLIKKIFILFSVPLYFKPLCCDTFKMSIRIYGLNISVLYYLFCWVLCLHFPKCFQQWWPVATGSQRTRLSVKSIILTIN